MKLMVYDVGGTEIKYALMDEQFNIYDKGYVPTPKDSFEDFAAVISEKYLAHKDEAEGIAMSLPGFIDVENGVVRGGGALLYNIGQPVGKMLEERCGCKVVLENDGKAAAAAEFYSGVLKGCQNAAVFVMGTAVGGGLIINGQPVRGRHFTAGEFSFINTDSELFNEPMHYMGTQCSTQGLLIMYMIESGSKEMINGREFFARLENDEIAQRVLDKFADNVAKQCYNLYWLLDLEKIAIGGGISRQPILIEKIKEKYAQINKESPLTKYLPTSYLEIVACEHGNDANMIGAFMNYLKQ